MQDDKKVLVSQKVAKSVAVASWSGFIYQGKIALYQSIKLLIENASSISYILKVEHLDDFAIFEKEEVLFLHQVKSTKVNTRGSYTEALKQAARIKSPHITKNTKRFFHVSVDISDFSDFTIDNNTVKFFKYHDNKNYISPDSIDDYLKEIIDKYLVKKSLHSSSFLIQHKFDSLNSLLAKTVNFAHALNQNENYTQYEATDATPIPFSEIAKYLESEVLNSNDKSYILFRFKNKFINIIDLFSDTYNDISERDELIHLSRCKEVIANLNDNLLEKLYLSLDPSNFNVESDLDTASIQRYLSIIDEFPTFVTSNNLPYYFSATHGKYIPSSIELKGRSKNVVSKALDDHLSNLRENTLLLDILFEFDNLIVELKESEFRLNEYYKPKTTHNGNCKDNIENIIPTKLVHKIIKAKNIRFVASDTAKEEIS